MTKPNVEPVELWTWRGYAIGSYSMFEHALCELFQELMGTTPYKAALVFFKMHNARARNDIVEKLLHAQFGAEYNFFWNSFFKRMKQLDDRRNSIVHWTTIYRFSTKPPLVPVPDRLVPPNMHGPAAGVVNIDLEGVKNFTWEVEIMASLVTRFIVYVVRLESSDQNVLDSWRGIFQKELVYPLPSDHLLFQKKDTP